MMEVIHNSKKRMPVILEREREDEWLDRNTDNKKLRELLSPSDEQVLEAYTISPLISRKDAEKNHPDIIKPFDYNRQNTLF
jgi:putative SOS response-associated peptidase YedK